MLTASAGGFTTTIRGAASSLTSLGSAVGSISGHIFSLTGALTGIASAGGLAYLVKGSMEGIAATGRLSDRMGIATEKLAGLQYAAKLAGVGSEELTTGLEKLLKSLSTAATEGGPAAAALAQMGLDAKQLASESPDQAFTQIADGLKAIQNPADRARATVELFGKAGQSLLPMLMDGAEGIKAAEAEAAKLGLTFSRVDAAKVELANQSFVRLQAVVEGAAQKLAIELSPFIQAAADKLLALANNGEGAGKMISNSFGTVLATIAELSDYLAVVEAGWQMLRSGASFAIGGILDGIAYLIDGINKLSSYLGIAAIGGAESLHNLGKAFYDTGKEAFKAAGEDWKQFSEGTNAKRAAKAMEDIQNRSQVAATAIAKTAAAANGAGAATDDWAKKLQTAEENAKKVTETLSDLQKQLATFGQTEGQKKIFDLKALGASPAQLAEAQKAVDQLTNMENTKKATDALAELQKQIGQLSMTEGQRKAADLQLPGVDPSTLRKIQEAGDKLEKLKEGQSITADVATPLEKYDTQITKLNDLLGAGAITWDVYGRSVRKAREELEQAAAAKAPEAFKIGSAEADKYRYDQQHAKAFDVTAGVRRQNPNKDDVGKLQYNEQYQSRQILQRIENKLTDANNDPTETIEIA